MDREQNEARQTLGLQAQRDALLRVLGELHPTLLEVISRYQAKTGLLRLEADCALATSGICSLACDALAYGLRQHGYRVDVLGVSRLDVARFGAADHEFLLVGSDDSDPFCVDPTFLQFFRRNGAAIEGQSPIAVFVFGEGKAAARHFVVENHELQSCLATVWGAGDLAASLIDSSENFDHRRALFTGSERAADIAQLTPIQRDFMEILESVGWLKQSAT